MGQETNEPSAPRGRRAALPWLAAATVALALCGLSFWAGLHRAHPEPPRMTSTGFSLGAAGPWGQLEILRTELEPPRNVILRLQGEVPPWVFPGVSRDHVVGLLQRAGVAPEALAGLPPEAWIASPDGVSLRLPLQMLLDLPTRAREAIYPVLAQAKENLTYREPFIIEEAHLDERLRTSNLPPAVQQTFRRLLYHAGGELVFANYFPMLAWLPDDELRVRFNATLVRRPTLVLRLRIGPTFDLDRIEEYWNASPRGHKMRPLLESLARLPDGADVSISYLLPTFARRRIFTYPEPGNPSEMVADCFWSALNFFNEPPDDRFFDQKVVRETIERDYRPVADAARFGDLVLFFAQRDQTLVHAAVHIADDVVFTKNGSFPVQPWIFMKEDELIRTYAYWFGPLSTRRVRRLDLAN